jgi:hypothetical protein
MSRFTTYILFSIILALLVSCSNYSVRNADPVDALPIIFPDYTGITIPPNIAPLNFLIEEEGTEYLAVFTRNNKKEFSVGSGTQEIIIPINKWKKLLKSSKGKTIGIEIYTKDSKEGWKKYKTIENRVSNDPIDPYIAYRKINPALILWEDMAIMQRDLEKFSEYTVISNQNTEKNCIHCHTFHNRDPHSMILHMRRSPSGTLIKTKEKNLWLTTSTKYTLSSFVYPAWHPNGQYIAFSTNKIHQNFYGKGNRYHHVRDDASDIVIYDIRNNEVFTCPEIASNDFENVPAWSPDGKYLYYIQAQHKYKYMHDSLQKYDLFRIGFDPENKKWGSPEMLVSSEETDRSVSFPQVSPDGKYVLFCMADYGYFTINNSSSDLYTLEIDTRELTRPDVNSNLTESFPSWSGNGRWMMFTSKRYDGMFTLPFFSYFDSSGIAHKPFVIPLKNPASYKTRLTNMNRPVFLAGKIEYTQKELLETAYQEPEQVVFDTIHVDIDALAGATMITGSSVDETNTLYKKN